MGESGQVGHDDGWDPDANGFGGMDIAISVTPRDCFPGLLAQGFNVAHNTVSLDAMAESARFRDFLHQSW
jgi:hypothetical protein